jgi:hypothetical protein
MNLNSSEKASKLALCGARPAYSVLYSSMFKNCFSALRLALSANEKIRRCAAPLTFPLRLDDYNFAPMVL